MASAALTRPCTVTAPVATSASIVSRRDTIICSLASSAFRRVDSLSRLNHQQRLGAFRDASFVRSNCATNDLRAGNAFSANKNVRTPPPFHYLLGRIHCAYWTEV